MASTNDAADIDDAVASGNPLIDGLLLQYYWSQSARINFQYTIPDSETDYEDTRDGLIDDYPDNVHEDVRIMPIFLQFGIVDAIAEYNAILPFQITQQLENDVDTQLRYGFADFGQYEGDSTPPAYAWAPKDDGLFSESDNWKSGDMFYNDDRFSVADGTELIGTYQHHTLLHETGHALGLKHGHEAEDDFPVLPAYRDSMEFTVMTYRSYVGDDLNVAYGGGPDGGYENVFGHFAQSLMMLDILALQYLYGADFTTQSGGTTYRWETNGTYRIDGTAQWKAGSGVIFHTIWDGGGNDTYDFSAFGGGITADLAPGGWTNLNANRAVLARAAGNPDILARGNVFNAMQHGGDLRSLIENAVGGAGNDRMDGNVLGNRLAGGGGDDILYGVAGNDTLLGGAGADLLNGGAGFDVAEYAAASGERVALRPVTTNPALGRWVVTGATEANSDILAGIEGFRFGEGNDTITAVSADAAFSFDLDGRGGNDIITGGPGFDVLTGGAGTDRLLPGAGTFRVQGGYLSSPTTWVEDAAQNDELVLDRSFLSTGYVFRFSGPSAGYSVGQFFSDMSPAGDGSTARGILRLTFTGGSGTDMVYGGLGANSLAGGEGGDYLYGNSGRDTLIGGAGSDYLVAYEGNDLVDGGEGADSLFGYGGDDVLRGGAGYDLFYGGDGNDRIETGGGGDLSVYGEGGDDTIIGAADAESFYGGAGDDAIAAGAGNDALRGEAGNDTLSGEAGDDNIVTGLGADIVNGGDGVDALTVDRSAMTAGVTYYLNGALGSDGARSLAIESFTYLAGSGGDTVQGAGNGDYLTGNAGDDSLVGLAGNDTLFGGADDDTLLGGLGYDGLYGGDGDDRIETGGGGDLSVYGEAGNDTLIGAADAEAFYGGIGNDAIAAGAGNDTLRGEVGDDTLSGEAGDDVIVTDLGADVVNGGDGFDVLTINRSAMTVGARYTLNGAVGSDGARSLGIESFSYSAGIGNDTVQGAENGDYVTGNAGDDSLIGLAGNDTLFGGANDDVLLGGLGYDGLYGGDGNDRIETGGGADLSVYGEAGDDTIIGAADAEALSGGIGNDAMFGRAGNDTLRGDIGDDTLSGEAGDDVIVTDLGADVVNGGDGFDSLTINRFATTVGVSYTLNGAIGSDGARSLGIESFNYAAGSGADTVQGAGNGDYVTGNAGNDSLIGLAGNDTLFGGANDDTLLGGLGYDQLYGGEGNDRIETGGGGDLVVYGEAGNDTLIGAADAEAFYAGIGDDSVVGGAGNDTLRGDLGNDTLLAGLGDDAIFTDLGADVVDGGDGFDVLTISRSAMNVGVSYYLNGPAGSDGARSLGIESFSYTAGSGADTVRGAGSGDYLVGSAGNDRLEGLAGNDTLFGGADDDTLLGGLGYDQLYGGDGNDRIETGGGGDLVVYGEAGNDTILGSADAEALYGGTGDDLVTAGAGNDTIRGDDGTDVLTGGAGSDALYGGTGLDRFVVTTDAGAEYLADFDADAAGGQDLVDLRAFGYGNYAGMIAAGATFTTVGADTRLDLAGGSVMVTFASVATASLNASDFIFA